MDGWDPAYRDAREETEVGGSSLVLEGIDRAREWFEQVIAFIDATPRARWRTLSADPWLTASWGWLGHGDAQRAWNSRVAGGRGNRPATA
jgi:hypothetical protein